MLIRKRLLAMVLAPCLTGCALDGPEASSPSALEKWAANWEATHEAQRSADFESLGQSKPTNTARWLSAQKHASSYEQALAAWQRDDTVTCRSLLTDVLRETPQHRDSLLLMAQLEMLERRPAAAHAPLIAYCNSNPQDASAQHMLGLVCESMGQKQAALARYRKAVDIAPENLAFQASVDGILNPNQSVVTPDIDTEMEQGSDDLLAGHTADPRTRIVDDYSSASTKTDDLLAASQQALGTSLKATSVVFGERSRNAARQAEQLADAESVEAAAPFSMLASSTSHTDGAGLYPKAQQKSTQLVPQATPRRPVSVKDPFATFPKSEVQQASATLPLADSAVSRPLTPVDEERDTAILTQAVELIRNGQAEQGRQMLDENIALERSARFYRIYGMAQYESGDAQAAVASLSRSLSLDDTSALAYFLMGAALSQSGREADAEGYFQQAARLDPRFARSPATNTAPDSEARR